MIGFETLYSWVCDLPIVDWHNHLDLQMLAEDKPLGSLYEVWVKADPYKHRAMRICGEPEWVVTGDATEAEKWSAWMRTLPKLVGNPLFAWAKMEMEWLRDRRDLFRAATSRRGEGKWWSDIENVSLGELTPSRMLKKFDVEYLSPCVGRDFFSSGALRFSREMKIVPSLRMNLGDEVSVKTLERFNAIGCRVVDVSIDDATQAIKDSNTQTLSAVAAFAAAHGWTMLLHLGALRETSARLRAVAGPVGGFAGMRATIDPEAIATLLDCLETGGCLPRAVLMSLNPESHAQLAVLSGSFVEDGVPGKVQLGPAWWWCDHEEGIRDVLEKNAAYGVLSTFVGMTTDSRSLLSFVRHDYFRRILCKWVEEKVSSGAFPDDEELLRPMLEAVCYRNARDMVFSHNDHKEFKAI